MLFFIWYEILLFQESSTIVSDLLLQNVFEGLCIRMFYRAWVTASTWYQSLSVQDSAICVCSWVSLFLTAGLPLAILWSFCLLASLMPVSLPAWSTPIRPPTARRLSVASPPDCALADCLLIWLPTALSMPPSSPCAGAFAHAIALPCLRLCWRRRRCPALTSATSTVFLKSDSVLLCSLSVSIIFVWLRWRKFCLSGSVEGLWCIPVVYSKNMYFSVSFRNK